MVNFCFALRLNLLRGRASSNQNSCSSQRRCPPSRDKWLFNKVCTLTLLHPSCLSSFLSSLFLSLLPSPFPAETTGSSTRYTHTDINLCTPGPLPSLSSFSFLFLRLLPSPFPPTLSAKATEYQTALQTAHRELQLRTKDHEDYKQRAAGILQVWLIIILFLHSPIHNFCPPIGKGTADSQSPGWRRRRGQ